MAPVHSKCAADSARVPIPRRSVQPSGMSRLRLDLSASRDVIPFARAAITRICEHLEIGDGLTEDIRLAVTEACSNCAIHAYDESVECPAFVLDARVERSVLRIVISDRGMGIDESRARKAPGTGYGLYMIEQLAHSSSATARPGGGTRVVMRFPLAA
jgi:anti-sigma regulatory factor (Ser/Thr protein kinase)